MELEFVAKLKISMAFFADCVNVAKCLSFLRLSIIDGHNMVGHGSIFKDYDC